MIPELRIHIALLGYLADRIYVPAIKMKADKLFLLRLNNEKDPESKKALKKIKSKMKNNKIKLIEKS
jgi:hypothetical protein